MILSRTISKTQKVLQTSFQKIIPSCFQQIQPNPTQIEDWDFIFRFKYSATNIQSIFGNLKCKQVLQYKIINYKKQKLVLIKISDKVIATQAEELKMLKKKQKSSTKLQTQELDDLINETEKKLNNGQDCKSFYLYLNFLRAVHSPQYIDIRNQEKLSVFKQSKKQMYYEDEAKQIKWTNQEILRAKYHFLLTYYESIEKSDLDVINYDLQKKKQYLRQFCGKAQNLNKHHKPICKMMEMEQFIEIVPIHRSSLFNKILSGSIRDYAGSNGQTYFLFITFMQRWLIFPILAGGITFGINWYWDYSADDSPVDFIYAFSIMVWSIIFITSWQKQEEWESIKQSSGYSDLWAITKGIGSKQFDHKKGNKSPVTNKIDYQEHILKKIAIFGISGCISFIYLVFSVVLIILLLNSRGYIEPKYSWIYNSKISSLSRQGQIFDLKTYKRYLPLLLRSMIVFLIGKLYRIIAVGLVWFQNHKCQETHFNSIILKYFSYEFIINFIDIFYIGFVRCDINGVENQFISIFFIRILNGFATQTLIPYLQKMFNLSECFKWLKKEKLEPLTQQVITEINKPNYSSFDQYRTIVDNFSYLVMFSFCFPFAPICILISNYFQLVQDKYKFIHICKRMLPQPYFGMGLWKKIILFICYISIVTNIFLLGFASHNIQQVVIIPSEQQSKCPTNQLWLQPADIKYPYVQLFRDMTVEETKRQRQKLINGKPNSTQGEFYVWLFCIQHLLLFMFFLLRYILLRRKSMADIFLERRIYKRKIKRNLVNKSSLQAIGYRNSLVCGVLDLIKVQTQ